jgi:hypothetical protein
MPATASFLPRWLRPAAKGETQKEGATAMSATQRTNSSKVLDVTSTSGGKTTGGREQQQQSTPAGAG